MCDQRLGLHFAVTRIQEHHHDTSTGGLHDMRERTCAYAEDTVVFALKAESSFLGPMPAEMKDRRTILIERLQQVIGTSSPPRPEPEPITQPRPTNLVLDGATLFSESKQ